VEDVNSVSNPQEIPRQESSPELLPLDARERVIVFRSGGRICRHIFRRITASDWETFFAHIVAEFREEKNGFAQVVDTDFAKLVVYNRAILRVEGYDTPDGSEPNKLPDWPECIPQEHRLPAVEFLMRLNQSEVQNRFTLETGSKRVRFDAMWSEGEPGRMTEYLGLVHKFATPKAGHRQKFLKAKNRSFIAGGSRNSTTIIPSAYPSLVKLYDELIEGVEGYSVSGRPLDGRDEIIREMDGFHKSVGVSRPFQTTGGVDPDGATSE